MSDLFFSCPVCGEDVPRKAKSCPGCGACEKSGWSEDHYLDGIDLPDEDYTTGRRLEGRSGGGRRSAGLQPFWVVVAAIVLVAILWLTLRSSW